MFVRRYSEVRPCYVLALPTPSPSMILQRTSPRTVAVGPDVRSEEALKSARENTTLKFASQLMDVEEGRKIKPWHHGTQSVIKGF